MSQIGILCVVNVVGFCCCGGVESCMCLCVVVDLRVSEAAVSKDLAVIS